MIVYGMGQGSFTSSGILLGSSQESRSARAHTHFGKPLADLFEVIVRMMQGGALQQNDSFPLLINLSGSS